MAINIGEFSKIKLKVGTVLEAKTVDGSDKLVCLKVNLGEEKPRQIIAGIGKVYNTDVMINRQIIVVANLEPKMIMGMESQGMLLAVSGNDNNPVLLSVDKQARVGSIAH